VLHLDPVLDAVAVGDHERRPRVLLGLPECPHGVGVVAAEGDLGDVDVAVAHPDQAQVLLAGALAGRGELGHRAARGRLRGLAARVRIDLGVQHEHLHVPAGGEHVVEAAEADVVGPAVAADQPDALLDQGIREQREPPRARVRAIGEE
jgi:predicted NAD/FAD-binding protein